MEEQEAGSGKAPRNEKQQQMKHVTRQSCVSKLQTCNLLGPESQVVAESSRAELRRPQTQQPGGCLRKMSAPVGCHCCCMYNEQAGDTAGGRSTPSDATQKGGESPSALVRQLEKFCFFFFLLFSCLLFLFIHSFSSSSARRTDCVTTQSECEETNECNCVCHFRFPSWDCSRQRRNQCTRTAHTYEP